ncbi:MAG: nucleotide exchange factor GrpE [Bacillota bacterium]
MKNKKGKEAEVVEEQTEAVEEAVEISAEDIAEAPTPAELAQQEVAMFKDVAQRLQAEFDNYRRRTNDSVKVARQDGISEVIVGLLPVLDTVQRAETMISEEQSKVGIQMISKQILNMLEKYGVEEIPAEGLEFNPDVHNAVMQVEDAENAGKVVEVLQKGYIRSGKVIRYTMVKVAS